MAENRSVPFLLKSDTFGTISRDGERVIRDTRPARPWARWLARYLMRRERLALAHLAGTLDGVPRILHADRDTLARAWIEGAPMHVARPRDPAYFRAALHLLRRIHAAGVLHNDLAKETNWLVTPAGQPALVDFQLATVLRRRGPLARARGHDDLRHLFKHKRTYLPERLTARQRRVLARRSLVSRIWMATGKPADRFITRRLLGWRDREGAGDRS
jgi:RIO-like serine/threonine protein kinase